MPPGFCERMSCVLRFNKFQRGAHRCVQTTYVDQGITMSSMSSGRQGTCCRQALAFLMRAKSHHVKGVKGLRNDTSRAHVKSYRVSTSYQGNRVPSAPCVFIENVQPCLLKNVSTKMGYLLCSGSIFGERKEEKNDRSEN